MSSSSNVLWSEAGDPAVKQKLQAWSTEIERTGREVITHGLPAKVLELNELLLPGSAFSDILKLPLETDDSIHPTPSSSAQVDGPASKKRKKADDDGSVNGTASSTVPEAKFLGGISNNAPIDSAFAFLRKEYESLVDLTDRCKVWLNVLVPRIEDNVSFGVQVQEECMTELTRAQESGYNLLDGQLKYHERRAKIASKVVKYPNVQDYRLALREYDRKTFWILRQHLVDLRNICALLTDLLHKNYGKLVAPKVGEPANMY